jgi:hypothetical protein
LYNIVHIVQSFEKVLINWLKPFKTYQKYCKIIELIFIKDCTIAPIRFLQFFSTCRLQQTNGHKPVVGVPISREFIQKYILGVNSACHGAAVPCPFKFKFGTASRPFSSGPKPLHFQIEMPVVALAQFEPS